METAPLLNDLAEGPKGGVAWWLKAPDGLRIRAAYWPGGDKGTVLLFPGRTEYIEKYGRAATELGQRGYGTLVIDWRGQGLADRMARDPMLGHVRRFANYQMDVKAMVALAEGLELPKPWYLIAHSMGGCIALRALHENLPVNAVAFSAPMWGINMASYLRPVAWTLSQAASWVRTDKIFAPGTKRESYLKIAPYKDNMLTTDADMYAYMQRHVAAEEKFGLGGPSLRWLNEALHETQRLRRLPAPTTPALTQLGTDETVVDTRPVHSVMKGWRNGRLEMIEGARHEIMMEKPGIRAGFFDAADRLFEANR
ncbi:MAG: alpha/beta hydrolase [Paracoccaceae bacterium]